MKPLVEYAKTYRGSGGQPLEHPAWFDEQPDGSTLLDEIRQCVQANPQRRSLAGLVEHWLHEECRDRGQKPPGRSALRRLVLKYVTDVSSG